MGIRFFREGTHNVITIIIVNGAYHLPFDTSEDALNAFDDIQRVMKDD